MIGKAFTRVDSEGVPMVVQKLKYNYTHMIFSVLLFNGRTVKVTSEQLSDYIGIMDRYLSKEQLDDCYTAAEKLFSNKWERYAS